MIHTHLHWSDDITKAPKGHVAKEPYTLAVNGKLVERERTYYEHVRLLALTNCGKVISTHWIPASKHTQDGEVLDGDRWHGFTRGQTPLLWALWPDAVELSASLSAINAASEFDAA